MAIRKRMIKAGGLPIIPEEEIASRIQSVKDYCYQLRDQALVSYMYLTGSRVEEIVKFMDETPPSKQIADPIKKNQIVFEGNFMIINNVRCLKRRKRGLRSIPIPISKEDLFMPFLKNYLDTIKDEDFLFNMTRQRALQILDEIGMFPHYLRHLRATYLTTKYGFTHSELKQFFGWTSTAPADFYVHLNIENLKEKMLK